MIEKKMTDEESALLLDAAFHLHKRLLRQDEEQDKTLLELSEYLYNIKTKNIADRFEMMPFSKWVAESFKDRDGKPRTVDWADWLVDCWRHVAMMPQLRALITDGYQDEQGETVKIKMTRAAMAAKWTVAMNIEDIRYRELLAEAGDKLTEVVKGMCKQQAAEHADSYACSIAKERTSSQIKEDLQVLAKERMGAADDTLPDERPWLRGRVDEEVLKSFEEGVPLLMAYFREEAPFGQDTKELPLVRKIELYANYIDETLRPVIEAMGPRDEEE